jgi:tetratricopeptide (TPR) repeat protein
MDPQIRRRRTLEAIKRILLRESLNQPLMIIFEDLHWIDSETQALVNLLVDSIVNARILLLVNYRPEYRHEWGSRTHYTQLRLDPLARESAEEMLSVLLGDEKDLIALKRLIIERTEGTPFFMEEMVQALFEEGLLRRNGMVTLVRPLSAVKVPATVQAVLASRIDRLTALEKEFVQTLAVLGHEFALNLVQRVTCKPTDELGQMLAQLQLGEFIYEQPAVGEVEYSFKHALTQEVAYNSLLGERRRALHDRAASGIEDLYAHQLEDHYSELAYHYLRGNDAAKAIYYAQLAAEQAVSRAAYPQAMSLINGALKLLGKLPEGVERSRTELALRTIESVVAMVLYGASSKERERAVRRMCELAESIGEGDEFLRALSALSGLYFTQGESARGLELARRCLALGEATQDEGLLADLRYTAAMLTWRCGSFREAALHFEDALRQTHRTTCRVSPQWSLLYASTLPSQLSLALQSLGRASEAAKAAEEGLRHARESRHLFSLGYALAIGGAQLSLERRQPDIARAHCEETIALSEESGFAEWLPWGRFIHGWALFELGQVSQGLAEMDAGIAGFQRLGGVPRLQYLIAVRAEAIARIGRVDEALTMLDEALAHIERSGDNAEHAEMLRLKGEILLMHDRSETAEAEKCFREALLIAQAQEAKWWELRATVSFARLLHDANRRDEARRILAEIYNWFTEGFDLPDLQEARALLDKLS